MPRRFATKGRRAVRRTIAPVASAASAAASLLLATPAHAIPAAGTGVQSDTLGMSVASYDFTAKKTTTVADSAGLSELIGAHVFVADGWRVGMSIQFTELLTRPPAGGSRFVTFGLLPQVGWHFYGPLFTGLVFSILPRTSGGANLDFGIQGVFGVSAPLAEGVNLTMALEAPFRFYIHRTLGLTTLLGLSFRL